MRSENLLAWDGAAAHTCDSRPPKFGLTECSRNTTQTGMNFENKLKNRLVRSLVRVPVKARHAEMTYICSADDDVSQPNDRLLDLALSAVSTARKIDLGSISVRMQSAPRWPDVWPGEHYRLLAGLVKVLKPKNIIEVGTFQGLGSLALLAEMEPGSVLTTLDIAPWKTIPGVCLRDADFGDGRLRQVIGDLADPRFFAQFSETLREADLIFADGPKDVTFERELVRLFSGFRFNRPPIVVFDDIRVMNMLDIWRSIDRPKLDLTSFGHWSGTGVVDWTNEPHPGR